MLQILKTRKSIIALLISIVVGFISAKFLPQGNPLVAIPWGIIAIIFALYSKNKKEALVLGGCVGFIASYAYLWFDNTDKLTITKIISLALLIILPAIFGLICGMLAAWLGWIVKIRLVRAKHPN
jgi:hypothetical protein